MPEPLPLPSAPESPPAAEPPLAMVGIVPAAGHAVRLQPLPVSKEALVVGGRPLLHHLLDRMALAGCHDHRVVVRPEKEDVRALARERGARILDARPPTAAASIAAGLADLPGDTLVLVGFPDSVWFPEDGFAPLAAAVLAGAEVALGLFRVDEPWRSDVVTLDGSGRVTAIAVKPSAPPSDWIWGCLAARAGALSAMGEGQWPSEAVLPAVARRTAVGVRLSDRYLDVGTRPALARAEAWLEEAQRVRSSDGAATS